jgi:hypothetical protein
LFAADFSICAVLDLEMTFRIFEICLKNVGKVSENQWTTQAFSRRKPMIAALKGVQAEPDLQQLLSHSE